VALHLDEARELGRNFRGRIEAVYVTVRKRRNVDHCVADGIQDRCASLTHFGFSERTSDRQVHVGSVLGRAAHIKPSQRPMALTYIGPIRLFHHRRSIP